jgi:cell division protein FtsW (lipid II flippase)
MDADRVLRQGRWREVGLLVLGAVILAVGHLVVWQAYLPAWRALFPGHAWVVLLPPLLTLPAWLLVSGILAWRRCGETLLVPLVALLVGIGLLMQLRLAGGVATLAADQGIVLGQLPAILGGDDPPTLARTTATFLRAATRQFFWFWVGWGALVTLLLGWRDYRGLARYKYLVATAALGLLVLTTLFGHTTHGQTVALNLGFVSFQPHDLVKVLLVIFLAAYLGEKSELFALAAARSRWVTRLDLRYLGPMVALWLLVTVIVVKHDDLGAALLLYGAFLAMLYLGTGRPIYVGMGLGLSLLGGALGYQLARLIGLGFVTRLQSRVTIWLDPWQDATGKGMQICQALMALGHGRLIGAGLAGGAPERIPAVHTDMIYAAISEDLGLVGAIALVLLLLGLIGRLLRVAAAAGDRFGQLLVAGLAATLAIQSWVILAGTIKLIPLTGITLPFISYGGTSLVVNLLLIGIALKVAERPRNEDLRQGGGRDSGS